MRTMEPVPLWGIIFINCMTILSSIWILIRLYRNRSKRSASFYIYGIASLIGLFLGVIIGLFLFIDTFKYKKTISKLSYASYPSVIKGYGGGIVFMFYGTMIILLYYNII